MSRDQAHPVASPAVGSWAAILWASRQFNEDNEVSEDAIDQFLELKRAYEDMQRREQVEHLCRLMERVG